MSDADLAEDLETEDLPQEELPLCEQCGDPKPTWHRHLPLLRPKGEPPKTRADCLTGGSNAARPCGWLTCKWWFFSIEPRRGWGPMCILDIADEGGLTLENVGEMLGITRERTRQIESGFLMKLRARDANAQGKLRAVLDDVNSLERE